MRDYHPNVARLLDIEHEAYKLGWYKAHPRQNFCEEAARRAGEMGNDYPSENALNIAKRMLSAQKRRNTIESKKVK